MPVTFLLDLSIVSAAGAVAILTGLALRLQGAAALGVAAAALAVVAIQLNGAGLAAIGLGAPPDLAALAPFVLAGLAACYLIAGLTSYVVAKAGLAPNVTRLDFIKGNLPALAVMLTISWTTAAFGEEIVFRGFLLNRGGHLDIGVENWPWMMVTIQAVLFGLAHAYQGLGGVIVTGVLGAALGVLTLLAQGNLWPAIVVHGLINTVSLTAIYMSETKPAET